MQRIIIRIDNVLKNLLSKRIKLFNWVKNNKRIISQFIGWLLTFRIKRRSYNPIEKNVVLKGLGDNKIKRIIYKKLYESDNNNLNHIQSRESDQNNH